MAEWRRVALTMIPHLKTQEIGTIIDVILDLSGGAASRNLYND
jgi:hypothetical protein